MALELTRLGPERRLSDDPDDTEQQERSDGIEGDPGLPPEGEDPMDGNAPSG